MVNLSAVELQNYLDVMRRVPECRSQWGELYQRLDNVVRDAEAFVAPLLNGLDAAETFPEVFSGKGELTVGELQTLITVATSFRDQLRATQLNPAMQTIRAKTEA